VAAQEMSQPLPIPSYGQDFRKEPTVIAFSPVGWLQNGRNLLK